MRNIDNATHKIDEPINPTYAYVQALVDEFQRAGMHHVVICPGSRSTPLAMTFAAHWNIRSWMHIDERSAAFFAMGMAKRLNQPVALVCTSGTAAANFLPAIVEAKLSHIPLIAITADRPHELRDCGAPQAIDQNRIYGSFAKWFVELALPEATNVMLQYIRTIAQRAIALARAVPAGPIHLNAPFREPLVPETAANHPLPPLETRYPPAWQGRSDGNAYVTVSDSLPGLPPATRMMQLAQQMIECRHGLIIVGPQDHPTLVEALLPLAQLLNYPVLADPLSRMRSIKHDLIISSYDAFLRLSHFVNATSPQLILRFGAMPTSKQVQLYLKYHASCLQVVIDGNMGWEEPTQLASELIHTDPPAFCQQLRVSIEALNPAQLSSTGDWTTTWQRANQSTQQALQVAIQDFPGFFEGRVFTELADLLPEGATLYVGNSMPIRDMDTFFWPQGRHLRLLGNRGANGIDGLISSALGASAVANREEPTVLVIGDLSFFHDLNGLLAATLHRLNLTIVLINNDGGGIFSFLPQAAYPEHFEQLFGMPTGLDFHHIGQMYDAQFQRVSTWEQFRTCVHRGIIAGGLHIVEVLTERESNVRMHRQLWQIVEHELLNRGIGVH